MTSSASRITCNYDVFLSYKSADRSFVEDIAYRKRDAELEPLFDPRYLAPSARCCPKLELILTSSKAVAILVGAGQIGSWRRREGNVAFDLQPKSRDFPVIPVLLPNSEPPLGYLHQLTRVDPPTQTLESGIAILAQDVPGEPPGSGLRRELESVRAPMYRYRALRSARGIAGMALWATKWPSPEKVAERRSTGH
jgi:TIR domain